MIPSDCSAGSSIHLHWCWLLDFHGKWWWVLLLGMRGEQLGGWMSDCDPWSSEKPWTSCYNTQQPLLFLSTCFLQPNIHFLIGLLTFCTHNLIHFSQIFIRRKAVEFPFTCIFLYICVIHIIRFLFANRWGVYAQFCWNQWQKHPSVQLFFTESH